MGTLANSEDTDEMLHNAAFHQGLYCLQRQNLSSGKEISYFLEIKTCDPSKYTMDHPMLTVSNIMGNSFGTQRVKAKSKTLDTLDKYNLTYFKHYFLP